MVCWMSEQPLATGAKLILKHTTRNARVNGVRHDDVVVEVLDEQSLRYIQKRNCRRSARASIGDRARATANHRFFRSADDPSTSSTPSSRSVRIKGFVADTSLRNSDCE